MSAAMEEKNQSTTVQLGGQQLSKYNTLKQMAGAKSHKARQVFFFFITLKRRVE